jgi:site-specific DNA-methyltransferase (adenine-specific)
MSFVFLPPTEEQCKVFQIDAIDLLHTLSDNSIKLVITDPPYGIAYHSGHYKNKNPHVPILHDWNFQIGSFFNEIDRILTQDGALYLFTRWDVYPLWANSIIGELKNKNCIIWMKNNWSAGDLTGDFGNQYEEIMFITKGHHKIRGKRWSNIWQFPRIPFGQLNVPSEKPVKLLERAILASSDENDLVVDPFCGSGSVGVAALSNNRKVLLGDIDRKMVDMTLERVGLKEAVIVSEDVKPPICPILKVEPPDPYLWGIHPEDILNFIKKSDETETIDSYFK